jgi:sulfatase modifying factor 1
VTLARRTAALVPILIALVACSRAERESAEERAPSSPGSSSSLESAAPPALLYVPSAEALLPPPIGGGFLPGAPVVSGGRCPSEMVDVRGEFCIDRYESQLVDARRGEPLSPYYHPTRAQTALNRTRYEKLALAKGQPALPEPPAFQLEGDVEPLARSVAGVIPNGYLSGVVAKAACEQAGKRLCTHAEWLTACRGQGGRAYPYGDRYEDGVCNVHRETHPAASLHGNPSRHHLDPRLNRVSDHRGPLLRPTGSLPRCKSDWGSDAVYDLVGNLDEWAADAAFHGGFYARATREGCEARIGSHPVQYFDYSLGSRCCR